MTSNEERKAIFKWLNAQAPRENQPGQKFSRGSRVKVTDKMPQGMRHFDSGFIGIVEYTYAQKFGGDDIDSYSLIKLNDYDEPINRISWYNEDQLTLIENPSEKGFQIIEEANQKFGKL